MKAPQPRFCYSFRMTQFTGDIHEWEAALTPWGVSSRQLSGVIAALQEHSIEPSEIAELVREYGRLGPKAPRPFPGFGTGDEKDVAADLAAVRENLRDALGLNKEEALRKNRVWYEA